MTNSIHAVAAALLLIAVPLAHAGGSDVKVKDMKVKVDTKGAVVSSAVLGSKSSLTLGGISAKSGKVNVGKFDAQINTQGAIVSSAVLGSKSDLTLGGISTQ